MIGQEPLNLEVPPWWCKVTNGFDGGDDQSYDGCGHKDSNQRTRNFLRKAWPKDLNEQGQNTDS